MDVFHSLEEYRPASHTVATIGTFDGVHFGHKTILEKIIQEAKQRNGNSLLISFHPHPRLVLFPENNPLRLLHSLDEKINLLASLGLDRLLLLPFTREFSRTSSKVFIQEILIDKVQMEQIVIGYDHRFGKNRGGGIEELRSYADELDFGVEEIPPQAIDEANVSSTKIRKALKAGDITSANKFLGYQYGFDGLVVHGEKQGRLLGYPTANMQPVDERKLIPADGVYFVKVQAQDNWHYGMMSIGKKPTMGEFERSHEVNIFDFEGDLYDQVIRVEFIEWIRGELKFDSFDELIAAIKGDETFCREKIEAIIHP